MVRVRYRRRQPCGWEAAVYWVWEHGELDHAYNVVGLYSTADEAIKAAAMRMETLNGEYLCTPRDIDEVRRKLVTK